MYNFVSQDKVNKYTITTIKRRRNIIRLGGFDRQQSSPQVCNQCEVTRMIAACALIIPLYTRNVGSILNDQQRTAAAALTLPMLRLLSSQSQGRNVF